MRISLLLLLYFSIQSLGFGQELDQSTRIDPEWVIDFQSRGFIADDIAIDDWGNIYSTGSFNAELQLNDSFQIRNPNAQYDMIPNTYFLMKHDSSGNLLWVNYAIGKSRSRGVEIDAQGYIYTIGNVFSSRLDFISSNNSISYLEKPRTGASRGIFICKYDSLGNILKSHFHSNNEMEDPQDFKIDRDNNLIIAGNIFYNENNELKRNYLLLKFNANMELVWQRKGNGKGRSHMLGITTDKKGNIYATGGYWDYLKIENDSFLFENEAQKSFISKFNPEGQLLWINTKFNPYSGVGTVLNIDAKNHIILAGSSSSNLMVARFKRNGKLKWWIRADKGSSTYTSKVLIKDKTFFIIGATTKSLFPSTDTKTIYLKPNGGQDFFFTQYNLKGKLLSVHSGGGNISDYGDAAAIYGQNLYFLGHVLGNRTFFKSKVINNKDYTMWISKFQLSK